MKVIKVKEVSDVKPHKYFSDAHSSYVDFAIKLRELKEGKFKHLYTDLKEASKKAHEEGVDLFGYLHPRWVKMLKLMEEIIVGGDKLWRD